MKKNNLKIIIPIISLILIIIVIVIVALQKNVKLPQATITNFDNINLISKNEITEEYFQPDIQKYTFEYNSYSYLNKLNKNLNIDNLSIEEKMSLLAYKLHSNNTNDNNQLEILKNYENEKNITYNSKLYEMSLLSIKVENFNELYRKEYNEKLVNKIDTFNMMYDNSCDNIIVHYVKDIDTYVYYVDASPNTKKCDVSGGILTGYDIKDNILNLYESKNDIIVGKYVYEIKDNEYIFKERDIINTKEERIEKLNFGKELVDFETYAYLAYMNESTKEENNSFNAGNNVCLSIDWLVNNGYYKNNMNLKGSVLFEVNNNNINIKSWLNNEKYSLQSIENLEVNKITNKEIITTIDCNGKKIKNVVYCDKKCDYVK